MDSSVHVEVRKAVQSDYPIVADLMEQTLDAFYGGDHRAHARRIFSAHIQGGTDYVGHFSFEQRMFVATVHGEFAGL